MKNLEVEKVEFQQLEIERSDKMKGWQRESKRHSLAASGIKTGRKITNIHKSVSLTNYTKKIPNANDDPVKLINYVAAGIKPLAEIFTLQFKDADHSSTDEVVYNAISHILKTTYNVSILDIEELIEKNNLKHTVLTYYIDDEDGDRIVIGVVVYKKDSDLEKYIDIQNRNVYRSEISFPYLCRPEDTIELGRLFGYPKKAVDEWMKNPPDSIESYDIPFDIPEKDKALLEFRAEGLSKEEVLIEINKRKEALK